MPKECPWQIVFGTRTKSDVEKTSNIFFDIEQRKIVIAGLTGYENKLRKVKSNGTNLHRSAAEGQNSRIRKKLLGKQEWFLDRQKEHNLGKTNNQNWSKRTQHGDLPPKASSSNTKDPVTVTVLAKRLQKAENTIARSTGKRVKIVERSGTTVRRMLHSSNPWAGGNCGRNDCLSCLSDNDRAQDCFQRNVLY